MSNPSWQRNTDFTNWTVSRSKKKSKKMMLKNLMQAAIKENQENTEVFLCYLIIKKFERVVQSCLDINRDRVVMRMVKRNKQNILKSRSDFWNISKISINSCPENFNSWVKKSQHACKKIIWCKWKELGEN